MTAARPVNVATAPRKTDPFYLTAEWRAARKETLQRDRFCVECFIERATHADHIKSRRLFPELELERSNLRGLCPGCHNKRSAQQYVTTASPIGDDGQPTDPLHPWNAGEQTRVAFVGAQRSPLPHQAAVLRAVTLSAEAGQQMRPRRAEQRDAEPVCLFALPGVRRA